MIGQVIDMDTERLTGIFKRGPLQQWEIEEIRTSSLMRFAQAYLMMARAGYRPRAPGDGFGNIQLSRKQLVDQERLYQEAVTYACDFRTEEDSRSFWIGCTNYSTNRAFVLCVEAARLLAGGTGGDQYAIRLLRLAGKEIERHSVAQRYKGIA